MCNKRISHKHEERSASRKSLIGELRRFSDSHRGAIAVMFVLLGGFLLGMVAFGFEGSRFVMERARLSDAMEQAALALSAEDNGNLTAEARSRNQYLATQYFKRYMRNEKSVSSPNISVSGVINVPGSNGNVQYVEYRVDAVTTHDSWFSSTYFPSFNKVVEVGDNGASRKYRSNIDVVFATDFSGSMTDQMPGSGGNSKITELKRIVLKLSDELYNYNVNNRVGFVPFNWGTSRDGRCKIALSTNPRLTKIDEYDLRRLDGREGAVVDYAATVNAIPNDPINGIDVPLSSVHPRSNWACLLTSVSHEVELTSSKSQLSAINSMTAGGGTFVSSGILRAAQVLSKSTAAKRVLVIVSDGEDDPNVKLTTNLINAGMCEKIKQVMATRYSVGKIAFVGVGYKPSTDWTKCVGVSNFYVSQNIAQLEEDLRRAVFEEVGHNTLKRF
ncbi:TadE/TadG family type IV pilus assembly protein [Pragia fontium]|uniref:Tight adherence protein G n=1 Tax=Pragia fontium DSM 5563 = ATCC 49100 TaxID=1122977 RepID=A0AAJ4W8A9_9GAMM|nr:TadE/TadG family type IV pilus assembly protein [Pragia fontium]SFC13361.1 tight adherence protein G [Pragia fontium DSM 5563 = ATCC 49100]